MGLGEPQPMPGTVGQPVQIVEAFEAEAVGGVGGWPPSPWPSAPSPAAGTDHPVVRVIPPSALRITAAIGGLGLAGWLFAKASL